MGILTVKNSEGISHQVDESKIDLAEKDGYLPVVSNGQAEHRVKYSNLSLAAKDGFNPLSSQPQQPQGYDYSNAGQVASDLGNSFMNALPLAGQATGAVLSGGNPAAAGFGQAAGESVKEAIQGAGKAIMHPQDFINSLSQLPTKEQVIDKVNHYMKQFNEGTAYEVGGQALGKGVEVAAPIIKQGAEKASQAVKSVANPVLDKAANALTNFTAKAGETFTGIPKENVKQYITNNKEINEIIAKNGGDMTQAADELRANLQSSIRSKVMSLNNDIKNVILNSGDAAAPKDKVIEALEKAKEGVNPNLYPDSVNEIQSYIDKVNSLADEKGMVSGKNISDIKGFFQDTAKGTYLKGGQVFSASSQAQSAAKLAGREARKLEISSMPETAQPNLELAKIHGVEKNLNKNLITPDKPDAALMAAGAGQNQRNVLNLKKIGDLTGTDALGEAQKLSTAKQFANAGWLPTDSTGKSFTRLAAGSIIGTKLFGPVGTIAGLAASSPAALKAAINGGQISKELFSKLAGGAAEMSEVALNKASQMAGTKEGQALIANFISENPNSGGILEATARAASNDQKGPAKWQQDGAKKLIDSGIPQEQIDKLKIDDKGKALLVQAASGEKALKAVIEKIKKDNPPKNYPITMRKNGHVASISNDRDYAEAKAEGWL